MSYPVVFRPVAQQDLSGAHDWYDAHMPGLGEEFLAAVEAALDQIAEHPASAPIVHRDIRRQLLHRFPHSIFYIVEDEQIVVLAVYHGRRDPSGWKERT